MLFIDAIKLLLAIHKGDTLYYRPEDVDKAWKAIGDFIRQVEVMGQ